MSATAQSPRAVEQHRSQPPYVEYATIMATFLGALSFVAVVGARRRRNLSAGPFDLAVLGLATFKAARTLSHDEVTSFLREPFVQGTPTDGEDETPLPTGGMRQALGELVTCSRCIGTWVAAGIAALDTLMPRVGRLLGWCLAVGGLNDWLQAGFAVLANAANRPER